RQGRHVRRTAALAALVVLCLGLIAGCGSGGSDSTTTPNSMARNGAPAPQIAVEAAGAGVNAARVYRRASPGVVAIRSVFSTSGAAEGSGFVLDTKGDIVTNAHVVTDESSGTRKPAKEVFVEFPDRNVVDAEIVGFDPFADVALLKIEPNGLTLHPLQLG